MRRLLAYQHTLARFRARFLAPLALVIGVCLTAIVLWPHRARSLPSRGPAAPKDISPAARVPPVPPPAPVDPTGSPPSGPPLAPRLGSPPGAVEQRPRLPGVADPRRQRGVSLGLFAEDVSFDYAPLLAEIAALGATHVQLVVPLYQEHGASTQLSLHTRLSPSLAATAEAIRAARRVGLDVMLFPIVRLASPRSPNEWRGTLVPADRDAWFASYAEVLGDLAALGTMTGVSRLAIGSELSSLDGGHEGDIQRWTRLLEQIRAVYPGVLVYSANWDHYQDAKLLEMVDEAGIVAYFELRSRWGPSDVPALEKRWRELRADIAKWRAGRKQPFLFTEVGYRSRAGATAAPWDESGGGASDLDEQRRAFAAFRNVWAPPPSAPGTIGEVAPIGFAGLYVWNWYGFGGPNTISYTPRGKPAAAEVKALMEGL
jgi:hypothetical protein